MASNGVTYALSQGHKDVSYLDGLTWSRFANDS